MRRTKTTAKPIKIAPSESGKSTGHDNSDVHGDVGREFIIASNDCDELNSGLDGMTVGSLPSVRRGRRSMVTSGGNERLFGGHTVNSNLWGQNQRRCDGRQQSEMLAASMPVPHAPFLSSRRDYETGNNLSSIPAINLPGGASESVESETMTYGSLRESTFARLNTKTAYTPDFANNKRIINGNSSDVLGSQLRIQIKKNTNNNAKGGLASLLDGADSTSIQSGNETRSGGMLNEFSHYQQGLSPRGIGQSEGIEPDEVERDINKHERTELVLENRNQISNEVNSLDSGSKLGTSLTGMDILKSSQPGLVDLTPEQKESLQQRVRDMGSYDGPVSPSFSSDVTHLSSRTPPNHLQSRTNDFHTQAFRETEARRSPFLIPPRDMVQALETEDSDGYDNRPPDDDIFDMDE